MNGRRIHVPSPESGVRGDYAVNRERGYPCQIPASIKALILGSVGGALMVAQRIPASSGGPLASAAIHGFISGMDIGLLVASVIVAAAALVVVALLPNRA